MLRKKVFGAWELAKDPPRIEVINIDQLADWTQEVDLNKLVASSQLNAFSPAVSNRLSTTDIGKFIGFRRRHIFFNL